MGMLLESPSIDAYTSALISLLRENLTNFNLLESNAATLDDNLAHELKYTYEKEWGINYKVMSLFTIKNNILYHIGYESLASSSYYDNLLIVLKILESFEILNENKNINRPENF
jgi:hypothetical protein